MRTVADPGTLEALCGTCLRRDTLAVDTEFERSVTFHPRPALIQLADGEDIWLVDPLAVADLSPLGGVLAAPAPLKIMHSALEDLTVLERATGTAPEAVFDTQLAAAFAGIGFGLGYHALVQELLGITISKDQTRSDWLRRPLSAAQIDYAAADVAHLHDLHRILSGRLESLGRSRWLEEETRRVFERAAADDVERDYLRLAGRADDDRSRGALHALVTWREGEARRRDRPRRHVADDPLLVALARVLPDDRTALEAMPEWAQHRGRARPSVLLEGCACARDAPPLPLPPQAADLTRHRATVAELKRIVSGVAADLGLDAALLAPRRLLDKAVIHACVCGRDGLPEEFGGWRAPLLEQPMLACLHHG